MHSDVTELFFEGWTWLSWVKLIVFFMGLLGLAMLLTDGRRPR